MINSFFISGTDTNVGKTLITGFFFRYFFNSSLSTITQKWIQTGSNQPEDILQHDDFSLATISVSNEVQQLRCPYLFKLPASPHLAASREKVCIEEKVIFSAWQSLLNQFDLTIVEGAGGLYVPFSSSKTMLDLVDQLSLPVVLVVKNALGAINQALLSIEALKSRGITLLGLIFSQCNSDEDESVILKENPIIVEKLSQIPVLGVLPFNSNHENLYKHHFYSIAKSFESLYFNVKVDH